MAAVAPAPERAPSGARGPAPRASAAETAAVAAEVLAPLVARGVIVRRPPVVGVLDRLDADRRAVRRLQRLRDHHGPGPVRLAVPGREVALVLDPDDVHPVLDGSPEPFAPASREKRAALGHFQPHGVLVSSGAERDERRRFNEAVLDSGRPVHRHGAAFAHKVREEAAGMLAEARAGGRLTWEVFARGWWRAVRRVTLGDGARQDHALTDFLADLRGDANWAFLRPRRHGLRARFDRQLEGHLERAEPGSLAALVAATPSSAVTRPAQQVPQWLFAFDAAGMAAFGALALLDAPPGRATQAREDDAVMGAAVLESVRLWPTTPAVLRDTTEAVSLAGGTLPASAAVVIFAPFFHRDDRRLEAADRFAPELWQAPRTARDWPLIPFSGGPAECAGRNVVLLTTSALLAALLADHDLRAPAGRRLDPARPLPASLNPFALSFEPAARG